MQTICFATYEVAFGHCLSPQPCQNLIIAASEVQEKVVPTQAGQGVRGYLCL